MQLVKTSAFFCCVQITYENTNDNGALAVDLRIEDHQIPCNKQHTDPTSEQNLVLVTRRVT